MRRERRISQLSKEPSQKIQKRKNNNHIECPQDIPTSDPSHPSKKNSLGQNLGRGGLPSPSIPPCSSSISSSSRLSLSQSSSLPLPPPSSTSIVLPTLAKPPISALVHETPTEKEPPVSRKVRTGEESTAITTPFLFLTKDLWKLIAEFSLPIDTYNLCLSSKCFHQEHLATKLLRCSLIFSLTKVLAKKDFPSIIPAKKYPPPRGETPLSGPFDFSSVMDPTGAPGVVLAGGVMVEACLGLVADSSSALSRRFCSDIDFFVTVGAAPACRSHLVEHNIALAGFSSGYGQIGDEGLRASKEASSGLHHVERWGPFHKHWMSRSERSPDEGQKSMSFYWDEPSWAEACGYGERINEVYVRVRVAQHDQRPHVLPSCMESEAHRITTLPGTPLPFDYRLDSNVDLVVGKEGITDARELVNGFDLTICKASFDGKNFHIPEPHRTFRRESSFEPCRAAAMELFASTLGDHNLWQCQDVYGATYLATEAANFAVRAVYEAGLYEPVGLQHFKPSPVIRPVPINVFGQANFDSIDHAVDTLVRWHQVLFQRLRKYAAKGVVVDMSGMPSVITTLALPRFNQNRGFHAVDRQPGISLDDLSAWLGST